ncbi:MAG: TonB-dependent receptor [Acidobacteria bacterium]|nr:TonB-dependent receptor [Acidobacteriota bacterium]MBV9475514.1 TonB-dependent receptor [Acidobacteriota bacterium]
MRCLRLLPLLLLCAVGAFAQTTGGIVGRVTDASGAALPGVTVEARSASLQGVRSATTTVDGAYRFALLPPGDYEVRYTLDGFAPEARHGVHVSLGKDMPLDATLRPAAVSEQLTVTAEAPIVDTNSTALGANLDTRAIETLPTERNYASIVQVVPGVASDANTGNPDQSTITVYGSSGAENSFVVDGVNTTGMEYGFQGKELNFEFIREVEMKTGGYEAEYGRSTGGIVNVITKSGGNELSGDVFGYYDNDSAQSNAKPTVSLSGTQEAFTKKDFGVDVGGFLLRDRLWFFAAYDRVNDAKDLSVDNPLDENHRLLVNSGSRRNLGSAKLTYNLGASQSLVATFLQDPRVDTGAISDASHTLVGDPSTYLGRQDFGGRDFAVRYDGSFSSRWIFSAQAARHQEENSVGPATAAGEGVQFRDIENNGYQTGGFGLIQQKSFRRDHFAGSLMRVAGAHEIKGGVEYEIGRADVTKEMSGGQQVEIYPNSAHPELPIYRHFYWTTPDATVANAPLSRLNASPEHKVTTAYLQDRWSVSDRFVVSAGLRWDRQQIIDSGGVQQINLDKDFAPRLGFIFDPSGNHTARVYGSYGRYYEELPMDLVIRSFSYERQPRIINYSPTSTAPDPAAEADFKTGSTILGGSTEPSDPNLENQYLNEYLLGYEREVMPNLSVGVKGIYRDYGQVIEDFLCDPNEGTYCIGNPGQGIMSSVYLLDFEHTHAAPKAKRTFKGVQLDATKRFSNHWQAIASYLYSKLEGNFDGEYAPFTNIGADPNISAAYDYYDFFTNGSDLGTVTNRGPLSNDRRHQLKVSGTYQTPWKLDLGASAYWSSGLPFTRYGYSDAYGRYEFFLTDRGGEGRMPSNYEADLHAGYPIAVRGVTVNLLLDVFNVLNAQRAVLLDERWSLHEENNGSATPTNADYGKPVLRTPPTRARFGIRVTF